MRIRKNHHGLAALVVLLMLWLSRSLAFGVVLFIFAPWVRRLE